MLNRERASFFQGVKSKFTEIRERLPGKKGLNPKELQAATPQPFLY